MTTNIDTTRVADTAEALRVVSADPEITTIEISGTITEAKSLRLRPGQHLVGNGRDARIVFTPGQDGVSLSTDNEVRGVRLETSPENRAIYNDTSVDTLGTIALTDLVTIGAVQILAEGRVRTGHVVAKGVDVVDADVLGRDRAIGYGVVDAQQGAFTIWNRQADDSSIITAELTGISAGREDAPVRGSGIFVGGAGAIRGGFDPRTKPGDAMPPAGRLHTTLLETGAVYSDGRIPEGVANLISGGVFVIFGATVDVVRNLGPVVTYGVNDMILDNWADVGSWQAEEGLISYGASGIGVVNFGVIDDLAIHGTLETFGTGARGFNVYLGVVGSAHFDRIETHGDAAIGVQVSHTLTRMTVPGGIHTHGSSGPSLVKGVITQLPATAFSVQEGATVGEVELGSLSTEGPDLNTLEVRGSVERLTIRGKVTATGRNSSPIHIAGGTVLLDISEE